MKRPEVVVFLIFLIPFLSFAQTEQKVTIKAVTMGGVMGDLIKLTINNPTDEIYYQTFNPFVYYAGDHSQAMVFPFGKIVKVDKNSSSVFYLNGFTLLVDKDPMPKDIEISGEKILTLAKNELRTYIESEDSFLGKGINKMRKGELIPYDYILTKPGTYALLPYYFNIFNYPELADIILIEQARLLHYGYERLYTAGLIITHFNNDPILEKQLLLQHAIWICAAGLQGKALVKNDFRKTLLNMYVQISPAKDKKSFTKYFETYFRLLTRLGKESKVYLTPEELDKNPTCLPSNVGLEAISDNIRTPVFTKERPEAKEIRNQVMLEKRNDILPCTLNSDMYASLYLHLVPLEMNALITGIDSFVTKMENSPAKVSLVYQSTWAEIKTHIEEIKKINFENWLLDQQLTKDQKIDLVKQDVKYELSKIKRILEKSGEIHNLNELEGLSETLLYLVNYILDVYKFMELSPSFDCCELYKQAGPDYKFISEEYRAFMIPFMEDFTSKLLDESKISSNLLYITSALYLQKAVLALYGKLTYQKQVICFEGPRPELRKEALQVINERTGLHLSDMGKFEFRRLYLQINGGKSFDFLYGECFCGTKKETYLPFLTLGPGNQTFNEYNKIKLGKKLEASGGYERFYFSPVGSDKFHNNANVYFQNLDDFYDSVITEQYNRKYFFNAVDHFSFTPFNTMSISLGYTFLKKAQIRLNYSNLNGYVDARLPFSYWKVSTDSTSIKYIDGFLYNKVNIRSLGLSGRYYFLKHFSPFIGAGYNYLLMKNTFAWAYLENIEFDIDRSPDCTASNILVECGLRYNVNLDFFIEGGGKVLFRNDTNASLEKTTGRDYGFFIGAGTKF